MRYFPTLVALVLALVLAGCSSGVKLPPVQPEQVEVFLPGAYPIEDYKVLANVSERVPLLTSDQELIDKAKERAARLGADGLVVSSIRSTAEGGIDLNVQDEPEKILEGFAIYFPSKHPELEEK